MAAEDVAEAAPDVAGLDEEGLGVAGHYAGDCCYLATADQRTRHLGHDLEEVLVVPDLG